MKLVHVLLLAVLPFVVGMLIATGFLISEKHTVAASYGHLVRERTPGYVALARSQRHFQIVAKHLNRMVLESANPAKVDELARLVTLEVGNFHTRTNQFEAGNPDQKATADANRALHAQLEQVANEVQVAVRQGNNEVALNLIRTRVDPLVDRLRDELVVQVNATVETQEAMSRQADARLMQATWSGLGILALALILATLVAVHIARRIRRQLGAEPAELAALANSVAQGDLRNTSQQLEPGSVMQAMQTMQSNLTELVQQVRRGSELVLQVSVEISQGNQELSGRTEAQAGALEQTSASMVQLGTSASQNATHAKQADELVGSTRGLAEQGGAVVDQVVETMKKGIDGSSKKIADIISVIDGIAFQTNILALNAAVEAARAGEQGRGFAVVASEVRNLAQRSAAAAREIKALIEDSIVRVESGSELVQKAGTTMTEIVASVRNVNQLMGALFNSVVEQNSDIEQVNVAVRQLDQATQQNAALVEQSAAASDGLKQQAQQLTEAVQFFKIRTA